MAENQGAVDKKAVRLKRHVSSDKRNSPVALPKKQLTRSLTDKAKGQTVKPDLVAADEGILERRRLFTEADAGFQAINRSWTVTWLRHRLREYVNIHGYASAGVCALLERAAEQYADGDYLRALAASQGGPGLAEGLHQAARHAQLARSHELAAWELAAREGMAKKASEDTPGRRNGKLQAIIAEPAKDITRGQPWGGVGASELEQLPVEGPIPVPPPVKPHPRTGTGKGGARGGGGVKSGPVSPFDAPRGVEGRGTPFSANPLETDSMSSPPQNPPPETNPNSTKPIETESEPSPPSMQSADVSELSAEDAET